MQAGNILLTLLQLLKDSKSCSCVQAIWPIIIAAIEDRKTQEIFHNWNGDINWRLLFWARLDHDPNFGSDQVHGRQSKFMSTYTVSEMFHKCHNSLELQSILWVKLGDWQETLLTYWMCLGLCNARVCVSFHKYIPAGPAWKCLVSGAELKLKHWHAFFVSLAGSV